MSGVQVLADGNPRQGGMDEDERDQCIHDVVNWFQRKAKLKNSTETSSDLQELEQALGTELPEALRSLLKKQSGGLWFDEYKAIVRTAETLAGIKGWKSSYIPFAADVDGAALITDVGSRNAVFEFGDDGKGSQLAPTLLQYLEEYRNRLLSGQYDYVEDVGLVERSRK
uniref:Knr4/Smi1-like domain-containing protein n=1 Tax=Globisporangium ultimum (strain ATCC 200006 / CBS 805.95 / DAOM BR144) TaxID=431595 RepID=K3WYP7_GLOUD